MIVKANLHGGMVQKEREKWEQLQAERRQREADELMAGFFQEPSFPKVTHIPVTFYAVPHNHTETSMAAAESVRLKVPEMEAVVLRALVAAESATREQLEGLTGLKGSTVRPRVVKLIELGLAEERKVDGQWVKRPVQSGESAKVVFPTAKGVRWCAE